MKPDWQKLQDFTDDHKDLLIMIASPGEDSVLVTFGGLRGFIRYPGKDMSQGVVFNALRQSKFEEAIEPFLSGIMKGTGISGAEGNGAELLRALGGSMKSIGEQRELSKGKLKKDGNKSKNK